MKPATRKNANTFCKCIKKVRKTIKPIKGNKESAAIAICVKSVLQTKGKTLRKFKCRNHKLYTRKMKA
jgi:hypothetical protein